MRAGPFAHRAPVGPSAVSLECDSFKPNHFYSSPPRPFDKLRTGVQGQPHVTGPGFADFTNEVQHLLSGVLRWDKHISISVWKNGARFPSVARLGSRSAKLRQLWIARHRASLGS